MNKIYTIIRSYLLNGIYAYALFGFYALLIAPYVTKFFDYREKNVFIGIFGFTMFVLEFFALNVKLKMIRIRAEERRVAYRNETGIDIIPTVGPIIFLQLFMRLTFRIMIVIISMTALGYPCMNQDMSIRSSDMSPQGIIVLVIAIFADVCGLAYIYFNSAFFRDPAENKRELVEQMKEDQDWDKTNFPLASSAKYYWGELISDIILQVYALMLFTSFWKFINQTGIDNLHESLLKNDSATGAAMGLFPMLFFMVFLGLMPIRIAYWIEDSIMAFTTKEKVGMWIIFFFVALFTCAPCIIKFVTLFILNSPDTTIPNENIDLILFILFALIILSVQIILFGGKIKKAQSVT